MKAILVIDKPSSCIECPYSLLGGSYCTLTQEDLIVKDGDISENCPLKPMPEKKDLLFNELHFEEGYIKEGCTRGWKDFVKEKLTEYDMGYNKCIDEILGEEE